MKLNIAEPQPKVMSFTNFKYEVHSQMDKMIASNALFVTAFSKDDLWETYINSFPEGSNPIFRERTEHDCQCCKQFIRACGNVVAIIDDELISIWDINIGGSYQVVADAMSAAVKAEKIADTYLHYESSLGTDHNFDTKTTNPVIRFDHFHYKLPTAFVNKVNRDTVLGTLRANNDVLQRSLNELTLESADIVLELIDQNSLYRGEEHRSIVKGFTQLKRKFDRLSPGKKDIFCWQESVRLGGAAKIRNTVIGTLMADISDGVELDASVKMFESKVAPENYKRPTALITQGMIKKAQEKVAELGIEASLQRRYAIMDDITINNVLFADRSSKVSMGVFDELYGEVAVDASKFDRVEEVSVDHFIKHVLPTAEKIEVMFENRHTKNLMSVIAPVNRDAPNILKWNNNFSWSYKGEVTDSIKDRVKRAGGNVDGVLRCSLSWFNSDDLDIHIHEPGGWHIYYSSKSSHTTGRLDVDMNAGGRSSRNPVENIVWTHKPSMEEGTYQLDVHNYTKRDTSDVGFVVEVEYDGNVQTFPYSLDVKNGKTVAVATFKFSRKNGIKFLKSIDSNESTKEEWGINTQNFIPVRMVMQSPNHWDGQKNGNKHWFFILDGCVHDGKARGLYNEFLDARLTEHRKVFEVLGAKMKAAESADQLSGLGFSSTKHDSLLCNVTGSFSRVIKIDI